MARTADAGSASFLGSEFDTFLFAPIGADRKGMVLSVLSALARLDIDPWQEAAKLAQMPSAIAIERLTSLIAALPEPDAPLAHRDPGTVAIRLTALLPRKANSNISSYRTVVGADTANSESGTNFRRVIYMIFSLTFAAFMLGAQFAKESHQSPAQIDSGHASASSKDSPRASMTDSAP